MGRIWQNGGESISGSPSIGFLRQDLAAALEHSEEAVAIRVERKLPYAVRASPSCARTHGLTQVQLAETLELTQQMIVSYAIGTRRMPVSLLPAVLAVSVEALIGQKEAALGKREPHPKLQQQMERTQRLPKAK